MNNFTKVRAKTVRRKKKKVYGVKAKASSVSDSRKAAEKRKEIILVSAELFAQRGYAGVTMVDIADALDTHASVLYYYFKNKDALVEALIRLASQRLEDAADEVLASLPDGSPLERLKAMLRSHAMTVMSGDNIGAAYQKIYKQVSPEIQERTLDAPRAFARKWQLVIDDAIESGDLRKDIPPRLLRLLLIGSIAWIPDWYKPFGPNNCEEIADAIVKLFLQGARSN